MAESNGCCAVKIFLKYLALDHGAVTIHDDKIRTLVLLYDLAHLLFSDMEILSRLADRKHISLPKGNFLH